MKQAAAPTGPVGVLLAVLFVALVLALVGSTSRPIGQSSTVAAAPQPTATYISELAPAVVLPPRQAEILPASGAGTGGPSPWAKTAGLGVALLGCLLIQASLLLRERTAR